MRTEYIEAALAHAQCETIDDESPFYCELPDLPGLWAARKTLETCRRNLQQMVEGWLVIRLRKGLSIAQINGHDIGKLEELAAVATSTTMRTQ